MHINGSFWLGLALSFPLSIVANLYTPQLQKTLAKRSERLAVKREQEIEEFEEQVRAFVDDPALLTHHLLLATLRATLVTALIGVLTGIIFGLQQVAARSYDSDINWSNVLLLTGYFFSIVGSLLVMGIVSSATRFAKEVKSRRRGKSLAAGDSSTAQSATE